jgi:alpha-tubulin suppressor-like RCC1 family protein
MSALDVLRQIKQARKQQGSEKVIEWGNADFISEIGVENLSRRDLRNHLEARDLEVTGTRLELIERLRNSIADEELNRFAVMETLDTAFLIEKEIEERGSVYVIGRNDKGQLGVGDLNHRKYWTVIKQLRGLNVGYVYAGVDMCFALTDDHDVYVWGGGGSGRTGIDPSQSRAGEVAAAHENYIEPQLVKDLRGEEIVSVVGGSSHCVAVGKGGDVFVWGDNDAGQLGLGHFNHHHLVAINNSFPAIRQAQCGSNHTVVLTKEGEKVYTWGHASNGRLGQGALERVGVPEKEKYFFPLPKCLDTMERIRQISCGADHTLALGESGCWSWGSGAGGRLGHGDNNDRQNPVLVPRIKKRCITQVFASHWYSMVVVIHPPMFDGGWVYSWGSGYHGQLGHGDKTVVMMPEVIEYFVKYHLAIKSVALGSHHAMALTRDNELYSWGNNRYHALGRKLDEHDVQHSGIPGHVSGFGVIVNKTGLGVPRSISLGQEFSCIATYPYEGPDLEVATKLMDEAKLRDQEALLKEHGKEQFGEETMG